MREMVMDGYNDDFDTRPRWLKAAAIGLGAVVLAAAAFGVGRWTAPASSGQRTTVSSQSGPGPWRVESGVPVGYAHTPDGAVAAATNFLTVVDGPLIAQPQAYRSAIDVLAAPDSKAALRSGTEQQLATFQTALGLTSYEQQGRRVILRAVPLTYHLDRYDGSAAQVSIWAEGLVAVDGVLAPHETWATNTYTLEWTAGDWRLTGTGQNQRGSDGPVPVVTQPVGAAPSLPAQLKDFKEYGRNAGP